MTIKQETNITITFSTEEVDALKTIIEDCGLGEYLTYDENVIVEDNYCLALRKLGFTIN